MVEKKESPQYSTPPPISSMLGLTGRGGDGGLSGKVTNVYMPNHQQAIMEYVSEPSIPDDLRLTRPLECMLIDKRALGKEGELDAAANDIEFDAISLFREVGGEELARDMALSYLHHREGLRTRDGFERDHQVMSKTLETLTTISQQQKQGGIFSRLSGFVTGNKPNLPGSQ